MKTKQILWVVGGAVLLFIIYKMVKKPDLAKVIGPLPIIASNTSVKPYVDTTKPIGTSGNNQIPDLGLRYSSSAALAGQY